MNRTKTILAAVGGTTLVVILAAGYFAWCEHAANTAAMEGDDEGAIGLQSVRDKAERLVRKPIYPGAESVKALTEARQEIEAWKTEAMAVAASGDRVIIPTTDAAFKEFIVADAHRLQNLPSGSEGKLLPATFEFGPFKPYITEGKMPEQAQLTELQRKWDDVATILETLSGCGVDSVSSIDVKAAVQAPVEEETPKKGKKKSAKKAAKAATTLQPSSYTYVVVSKMRPEAFVRSLNVLASTNRFMVVTDVNVRREKDVVAEALGVEKKDEAVQPTEGRRRRRPSSAATKEKVEDKPTEEPLYKVVADPATEIPFEARLTIAVYDFRSSEIDKEKEGEVKE